MIIKKDGIKGKNGNEYKAEIIISASNYNTLIYLKTERKDVLVRSQVYFGNIERDRLIKNIKTEVKMYEEKALKYPMLDDWDGEVY